MKKIWVHKANSFKEAADFDKRFWRAQGARARFAATWKTIEEFYKIRGISGYKLRSKLRLQRSVQNIIGKKELNEFREETGRPQDQIDLERLRKIGSRSKK